jgi:hypothetical protein
MVTDEQMERMRNMALYYADELPDIHALNGLLLIYDVCEILNLSPAKLETIFGTQILHLVTATIYGIPPISFAI